MGPDPIEPEVMFWFLQVLYCTLLFLSIYELECRLYSILLYLASPLILHLVLRVRDLDRGRHMDKATPSSLNRLNNQAKNPPCLT